MALTIAASMTIEKRVILLLSTLLVANPVILFLITHSVLLSLSISAACIVLIQFTSSPTRRVLAAYAFNALALTSIFLHAEVILVHAFPERVVENLYTIERGYYFNKPQLEQIFTSKEYSVHYRTNAQGLRIGQGQDPAHTVENADWLVLGDSFTQGAQVEYDDLYSTKLNELFPDRIIVNAGISGFGIAHAYNYFVDRGHQFHPKLVLLQLSAFNDFMNVAPTSVGLTDRLMTHSAFVRFLLADLKFKNPASLPLGRWTEPFQPSQQDNIDYNIFFTPTSEIKKRDIDLFAHYLALLSSAVAKADAKLVIALIPTKEQVYQRYLDEVVNAFNIDLSLVNMQRPNEYLTSLARSLGVEVIDLLATFKAAPGRMFFDYDEHMSPAGHRVLAEAVGTHLRGLFGKSTVTLLSRELAGDRYPTATQDGTLISFQSFRSGNMELFIGSRDLSERTRLTFDDVDQLHPMLSPDNAWIVFTEGSSAAHSTKVVRMKTDGSERHVLTPGPNHFGAIPSVSTSGRFIAFAEWDWDSGTRTFSLPQVAVLDLRSNQSRRLTPPDVDSWRPVISPREEAVVYISRKPGATFDLHLLDLATGRDRVLTATPFDEWDPQFTPDGLAVVYAGWKDGNWDLFRLDLATGLAQQLTSTRGDEWDPSVTPDGLSLLFAGRYGLIEAIYEKPLKN